MMTTKKLRGLFAAMIALALTVALTNAPVQAAVGNDVSDAVRYSDGPSPIGDIVDDLAGEDDEDTDVALPFPINYFGQRAEALCISTNGLIFPIAAVGDGCSDRYDRSVEVLAASAGENAIAALAADISFDSEDNDYDGFDGVGQPGNIYYGETTVDGKPAVAITYYRAKMFDDDNDSALENTFQIVLIQNGATTEIGYDFLIEFNYGTITDGEEGYSAAAGGFSGCDEAEDCRWGVGLAHTGEDDPSIAITSSELSASPAGAVGVYDITIDPGALNPNDISIGSRLDFYGIEFAATGELVSVQSSTVIRVRFEDASLLTTEQKANIDHLGFWGTDYPVTAITTVSEQAADPAYAGSSTFTMRLTAAAAHGLTKGQIVSIWPEGEPDNLEQNAYRRWRVADVISDTVFEVSYSDSFNTYTTNLLDGDVSGWSFNGQHVDAYELFAGAQRDQLLDGAELALTSHSMHSDVLGRYMYSIVSGEIADWEPVYTDSTAPTAPRDVTATRNGTSVTVNWRAPADNGGADVTGYTVTVLPTGESCTTATTSCVFGNLADDRNYTFSVVATNSVGDSEAAESNTVYLPKVKVAPKPKAPVYLTVMFNNGSAQLTEKAKANLDKLAAQAKTAKTIYFIGYTSKKEATSLSLRALSLKRAKAVSRYMWAKSQIAVHVMWANGARNPISEDKPFKNRRVRVKLTW